MLAGLPPSATVVLHAVHGPVHVHGPVATPEHDPMPMSPGPLLPSSTVLPQPTSAAAPVHPAQAAASSAPSTSSHVPPGAATPVHPARAAASSTMATGRTADTRPVSIAPVTNAHSMRTHGKAGIAQPVDCLNLHTVPMSPLPCSVRDALSDPNWRSAMQAEYDALIANDT